MLIRQEQVLQQDMQRVVDALLQEDTNLAPYRQEYRELLANHGKMLRASLLLLFSYTRSDKPEPASPRVIDGAKAIELMHLATLVHDDVLDNAPIRRHKPTVNAAHGNKTAIYLGDLVLSRYMEVVAYIAPDNEFIAKQARTMSEIVSGDLMQESTRHDAHITKAHYEQAINGKTAALFRAACTTGIELAAAELGTSAPEPALQQAEAFGTQLGLAFQIADDIGDFEVTQNTGKPKFEDINDGIYTLPVILAREADPDFMAILETNDTRQTLEYLNTHPQYIETAKHEATAHAEAAKSVLTDMTYPALNTNLIKLLSQAVDKFIKTI
jgi:heptaprenyl diphosphate synthase